jgi:glycolate oxidase iron-sulfur subunit
VGLVLGCVQRLFEPAVNSAAVKVLAANGIEVVIPPDQGCCGAVTHHQGELAQTRELAASLMASFEAVIGPGGVAGPEPLDALLVAASGCGHTLRQYDKLLDVAHPLLGRVADIQEFLDAVGLSEEFQAALRPLTHDDGQPASADRPIELVYHDACHQLHGQGLQAQPRRLLGRIPHVRIREATEAGVCCGSAGIYNLVQPEEATELGRIKAADLCGTGAELAVSANIGCTLQIRQAMETTGRPLPVLHPLQLLERSISSSS